MGLSQYCGSKLFTLAMVGLSSVNVVYAGNTTCAGSLTDWYTNAVGETACETYQRLRQICNPQYQVPSFRSNTPGDQCDDQQQQCCCNSISWALSMLCMNCQWDVPGGSSTGIDAGVGAYALYRAPTGKFCSPGTNQSLPLNIQAAACNFGIKLDDFLYDLFWSDGSWYFVYTMETASVDKAAQNNNTFTHCNSTTQSTTKAATSTHSATSTRSATPTSTQSTSHSTTAKLAGGVVGGVVGLILMLGVAFTCWRRRRTHQVVPTEIDEPDTPPMTTIMPRASAEPSPSQPAAVGVTPYMLTTSAPSLTSRSVSGYASKIGHQPTESNVSPSVASPRSDVGTTIPSQSSSDIMQSTAPSEGALRHDDLGPVSNLGRSPSGRLPPAYNPDWDAFRSGPSNLPEDADEDPRPDDVVPNVQTK